MPRQGGNLRIQTLAGIAAIILFVAYFFPMMIKLKDGPLAVVLLGGFALAVADLWESLRN